MGDSCTDWGKYDKFFAKLVAKRIPGHKVTYANFGVVGWSTYQGLQQVKRDLLDLKPKVITIYYGWNDHWVGFGIEDKEVPKASSPLISYILGTVKALSVLQNR